MDESNGTRGNGLEPLTVTGDPGSSLRQQPRGLGRLYVRNLIVVGLPLLLVDVLMFDIPVINVRYGVPLALSVMLSVLLLTLCQRFLQAGVAEDEPDPVRGMGRKNGLREDDEEV